LNKELNKAGAGGRTGPTNLYCHTQIRNEKGMYVDMTSLYPWVNAYGRYPVGHPVRTSPVWDNVHAEIMAMENLAVIRCDVTCPSTKDVLHPLLHYRDPVTNRLMFDMRTKKDVSYTSLELQKEIDIGYTVTKVHEVIEWHVETVGIFKDYVFDVLKLKQEAAGWPRENMREAEKEQYMEDYFENQGIRLDRDKIGKNAGMYATAKFYLNSLWGKFNQSLPEEMTRTSILFSDVGSDELALNKIQSSDGLTDVCIINERCVLVNSRPPPSSQDDKLCYNRNYSIGVFTTAQARSKLYEGLERLDDRVM
jgi:hypothetical protein